MPFPADQGLAVLKESVEWFAPESTVPLPPFAYDMQPDRPWPERNGPTNFTEQAAQEKEAKEAKEKAEGRRQLWRRERCATEEVKRRSGHGQAGKGHSLH